MTSTPSLRLVYFQVRARVESARMILAYGNIAYKDDDCNSYFGMSFPEAKKAGKKGLSKKVVQKWQGKKRMGKKSWEKKAWLRELLG